MQKISAVCISSVSCSAVALAALCPVRAEAGIVVTAEAAKVQASTVSGVTTETFNSLPTGGNSPLVTAVGTLTSTNMAVMNANVYGGAGRTGRFISLVGSSTGQVMMALTLNAHQSYFGFWWSSADAGNAVEFYSGETLLGTFKSATALSQLSSSYNGNPNGSGGNNGEKYAYLNFFGTEGTAFDRIVFRQLSLGGGFEMDNLSIYATPITPPFPGTEIPGAIVASPEPSTIASLGMGGIILLAAMKLRGRARRPKQ